MGEEKFSLNHFENENSLTYSDIYIPSRNVAILVTDKNNTYYSQVDPNMNYMRRERYLNYELPEGVQIVPLNIYELYSYEKEADKLEYLDRVLKGEGLKREQESSEDMEQQMFEDGEEGEKPDEGGLDDIEDAVDEDDVEEEEQK